MFNSASGVFVDIEIERDPETDDAGHGDFETAINFARFGKFQKILLAISGLIYATCAISSTTLSFVLPSAQCDFRLTSVDKGKLSAMPLVGMLFGCCLWGSLADSHGRKVAIILSLLLDFLSGLLSSFVTDFNLFLACRFFNGFGIIGATSIIFSYLGEFISIKDRDRILGKLEIFWNIGIIILPGVAWSLLGKKTIEIIEDGGSFSPWRTFVLICSLPSLFSAVLLYFLPETPKYLISKKMYEKARLVFQKIYTFNTGDDGDNFPVHHLQEEDNNNKMEKKHNNEKKNFWKDSLSKWHDLIETLRSHQYLRYLGITCFADFGLMASYYTLVLWFPEIFERFDSIGMKHSNNTRGVCAISQTHIQPSKHHDSECDPFIENKVFLETLLIALSCIPTSVSLSYFMYKLGKKVVLVFCLVCSGIVTISLNWVTNSIQVLILSCFFEALTSILEAVLFCVIVDFFPTSLRALSLTLTATSGRLGAIFGNLIFGILLDMNCIIPVYLFGFLLMASGILCLAIPRNEDYITIQ